MMTIWSQIGPLRVSPRRYAAIKTINETTEAATAAMQEASDRGPA